MKTHFDSDEHALITGLVLGQMKQAGLTVEPVTDSAGNYKPMIRLFLDLGHLEVTPVTLTVEG